MESQPKNAKFRINPENFNPWIIGYNITGLCARTQSGNLDPS